MDGRIAIKGFGSQAARDSGKTNRERKMGISGKALGGGRAQEVHTTIIGAVEQADDTTILREMDEIETVEAIFVQTLKDCTEKSNEGKTERIFVSSDGPNVYDVRRMGAKENTRVLGAILDEQH